jgi:hypothetical protein
MCLLSIVCSPQNMCLHVLKYIILNFLLSYYYIEKYGSYQLSPILQLQFQLQVQLVTVQSLYIFK